MVTRVAVTTGAPGSAAAFAPTLPTHAAGDRLLLFVLMKYNTATTPTINQGWTTVTFGSGGTGSAANDTGQMKYVLYYKDATSSSETAPTVTPGGTAPNSWTWICASHRPTSGYSWRETVPNLTSVSDTSTASPLTGTFSTWNPNHPTTGDALFAVGCIPTDLGTALGATTLTNPGLSGGTVASATTQYVENALGTDSAAVWAGWTGFTGTSSGAPTASFTVTGATNHSGMVVVVALREVAQVAPTARTITATVVSGTQVDLSWTDDTAAFPNPTYLIEKSTDGVGFTTHASNQTNQTSYSVTGLTQGTPYWFKITGTNASGSTTSNTVTATPVSFIEQNNLDMGSDETAITVGNSAGSGQTAFDGIPANGTAPVFDSARSYSGGFSARCQHTGSIAHSLIGWNFTASGVYYWYTRFLLNIGAYPSVNATLVAIFNTSSGVQGGLEITPTGKLQTGASVSTATVPLDTWVRVEMYLDPDSSNVAVRYYLDPQAAVGSFTEELNLFSAVNTTGIARYGTYNSPSAGSGPFWFDDIIHGDNGTWFGPSSVAPATPNAGQFGMIPIL